MILIGDTVKYFKNENLYLFLMIASIYILFSNGRITTSMDVDVLNYAKDFYETGSFGSDKALASGIVFSPYTEKFYPMEGFGVVLPYTLSYGFSKIFGIDSIFPVYMTNQILSALSVLFLFMTLKLLTCRKKSLFLSLTYALATPIFVHSKYLLPEPVTMVMFSGAFYFYFKYFIQSKKNIDLFFSLLFGSFSLICRPDSPIFVGLFSLLILVKLIKERSSKSSYIFSISGLVIGVAIFSIVNYSKFGSTIETGYTLTRDAQSEAILKKIESFSKKRDTVYKELEKLFNKDKESEATKLKYAEYQDIEYALKTQDKFFKDIERMKKEHGSTPNTIEKNSVGDFLYGIVLSTIYPNRSIFFLSPVLLLLIPLGFSFFRKYRVESIGILTIMAFYLSLYSLRAPLSYAGSAAWGVRYLLPMYPLMFIMLSGKIPERLSANHLYKRVIYLLFAVSIIFQIIGSSVNYQSVQMPLEYACKQKFGTDDMKWARESRKELMTTYRASLLRNNLSIISGKPPIVLESFLGKDIYKRIEKSGQIPGGVNDWFFKKTLFDKDGDRSSNNSLFILLFFILTGLFLFSVYNLYNLFFNKIESRVEKSVK
ncbi:MAG: hypothetical protein CR982_00935 [Candidatus Cloacimonadota bacterium]|nr:MAG: hypothetical protein CR982_00935 [Candidatus Cloacimonadota bacterium]PIE77772.1 MAG: hypothetical protein CSA15_11315 [Candidatus Delongbacteria bacterium]